MIAPETIERIRAQMAAAGLAEADLRESFILGTGPGGQKTNKTSSTVRLVHEPTGCQVRCGATRSRETNRWLARRQLAETLLELAGAARSAAQQRQEKIRRQKRRRSRRQRARMLDDKKAHSAKKAARKPVRDE